MTSLGESGFAICCFLPKIKWFDKNHEIQSTLILTWYYLIHDWNETNRIYFQHWIISHVQKCSSLINRSLMSLSHKSCIICINILFNCGLLHISVKLKGKLFFIHHISMAFSSGTTIQFTQFTETIYWNNFQCGTTINFT